MTELPFYRVPHDFYEVKKDMTVNLPVNFQEGDRASIAHLTPDNNSARKTLLSRYEHQKHPCAIVMAGCFVIVSFIALFGFLIADTFNIYRM